MIPDCLIIVKSYYLYFYKCLKSFWIYRSGFPSTSVQDVFGAGKYILLDRDMHILLRCSRWHWVLYDLATFLAPPPLQRKAWLFSNSTFLRKNLFYINLDESYLHINFYAHFLVISNLLQQNKFFWFWFLREVRCVFQSCILIPFLGLQCFICQQRSLSEQYLFFSLHRNYKKSFR